MDKKPDSKKENGKNIVRKIVSEEFANSLKKEEVYNGYCKWYNPEKGYGFIGAEKDGQPFDAWVHISNINSNNSKDPSDAQIFRNQLCTFQIQIKKNSDEDGSFRLTAVNVIPGEQGEELEDGEKQAQNDQIYHGICSHFDREKKFGFLVTKEKDLPDVFVHIDQIKDNVALQAGQKVTFQLRALEGKRVKAVKVVPEKFEEDSMSKKMRKGIISAYYADRGFGFLVEDGQDAAVFFHKDKLRNSREPLDGQEVLFKIRKKIGFENTNKLEAFDLVLGSMRQKEIYHGVFKLINKKERTGLIERKDTAGFIKKYVFDFEDITFKEDGSLPKIKVDQPCTFSPKLDRKNQFRALYINPQAKELKDSDYLGFEPYLRILNKAAGAKGRSLRFSSADLSVYGRHLFIKIESDSLRNDRHFEA